MRTVRRLFNVLVLLSMALGLVLAPTSSVSADPEAPVEVVNRMVDFKPANAKAGAHFVFVYQLTTPVPLSGEFWVQWPTDYYSGTTQIDDLGNADLDVANVSWSTAQMSDVYTSTNLNNIPSPDISVPPDGMNTQVTQSWIPAGQVRLTVDDTHGGVTQLPAGTWVRIDFWGPANINPGEKDAEIAHPYDAGYTYPHEYCWGLATDEEQQLGDCFGDDNPCACKEVKGPLAVRLWRKYQVPLNNCGYNRFEYVRGFETIEEAVFAADEVWMNNGDYVDEPAWNLFDGCPDFSDVCNPADGTDVDCEFVETIGTEGVAVGAVIEVDPGVYTDTMTFDGTEPLNMDAPGVVLGSTGGPDVTHIVGYTTTENVINITAGGITLGESEFDKVEMEGPQVPLHGFDVYGGKDGVMVNVTGDRCNAAEVYSSTVEAWDMLSGTVVTDNSKDIKFDCTENVDLCNALDNAPRWPVKLVNLTNGWSAHIADGSWSDPTATLDITATERFTNGQYVAIFYASEPYDCVDARSDVRGNEIHANTNDGISVYSSAIWVDSNKVYENDDDGFYGKDLKSCGSLMVCDGMNRNEEMLELSNNEFYLNGSADEAGWGCGDLAGEFNPNGEGNDAGIYIMSTGWAGDGCAGCTAESTDDHLYIHDNMIHENTYAGIWLREDAADAGIRILRNDILDNEVFGLSNQATCDARNAADTDWEEPTSHTEVDVIFKYNNVFGNGYDEAAETYHGWGVKNWERDYPDEGDLAPETGAMFNAKENFWNFEVEGEGGPELHPGGPYGGPEPCTHLFDQRSAALGNGDAVNKGTYYNPWLAEQWEELTMLPDQGMRAYGSDSLKLQAGWNTLAVPIAVDNNYDTVAEILDLGEFLKDADDNELVERVYEFNNVDQGWQQNPELEAVHGYYIKIDPDLAPEGTKFPVIYNTDRGTGLPYYDLTSGGPAHGWNLIGSAFGIDKVDNYTEEPDQGRYAIADPDDDKELEASKAITVALDSIIDWTGRGGMSTLYSDDVPGQLDGGLMWQLGLDTGEEMYTGQAYWAFMTEDRTLNGFEMTPLYLDYEPFPIPLK